MLIVITQEGFYTEEHTQIHELFDAGLQCLHVRKPNMSKNELRQWITNIDKSHHHKLMLHQHHTLAEEFSVKGIHLKENDREKLDDENEYIKSLQHKGKKVSTSFHDMEKLKATANVYNYVFLSPVFNSISKEGYKGNQLDVSSLKQQVMALGGICVSNIKRAHSLGYKGVAVLGSIWNQKSPLEAYKEINEKYNEGY